MYILYLDESGNPDNPADKHFVLGGVAVFEQSTFFLNNALDDLQQKHFSGKPPIDFHAGPIRSGKGFWRAVLQVTKDQLIDDIGATIKDPTRTGLALFAAVVEKHAGMHGEDAVKCATEQVIKRFDTFLQRRYQDGDKQRGLVVFAESHYQARAKVWVHGFRSLGTQWGVLHNLADTPYFAPARENRLLQAADYVAHGVFLLYERRDPALMKHLISRFDQKAGVIHGLVHILPPHGVACECPAHASRRSPATVGTWL